MTSGPLLRVAHLDVRYGDLIGVSDVSFEVPEGSVVALLGSNGGGKTTTLNAIAGLIPVHAGQIEFRGEAIAGQSAFAIVRKGLALSPEGWRLFVQQSVENNLLLGATPLNDRKRAAALLERVYAIFPRLKERRSQRAGTMSGGERQMLAVGRALMSDPKLLMLDEPSLGLAPAVVESMYETFGRLHREGLTILLAEQSIELALEVVGFRDRAAGRPERAVRHGCGARRSIRRCSTSISARLECKGKHEQQWKRLFGGTIGKTIASSKPWWPEAAKAPDGAPNILVVLFDDVGFSDFGCYGSPIRTPTIDRLAAEGLRYSGFHTTAMCSTTRAALLTGRNHHSVGVGCLANFNSGYPGYRGKIAREAGTLAEMLRAHAYRNYMVGKWHVTPLTESGATGPFDGWPLGRGFDRFYGFLDAETDQYAPELVSDNTHIDPPGDVCRRLSPDLRPGRSGDPLHRRSPRRPSRSAVADLGRARRLPCAASGAGRHHQELRSAVRPWLGRRARAAPGAPEGVGAGATRHQDAGAQ